MRELREDHRFRFLFVGGGGKRAALEEECRRDGVTQVEMRPYVDRDKLSEGLAAGDIGLVTQVDVCSGSVVPSKVYGIMAAGRPLLFIGPRDATPSLTIDQHGCGWHVNCGEIGRLTELLKHLAGHPEEVEAAGRRARAALLEHYDLPLGIERIADVLETAHARLREERRPAEAALRDNLANPEVGL